MNFSPPLLLRRLRTRTLHRWRAFGLVAENLTQHPDNHQDNRDECLQKLADLRIPETIDGLHRVTHQEQRMAVALAPAGGKALEQFGKELQSKRKRWEIRETNSPALERFSK